MKKSMLAVIFGSALFLAACGGGDEAKGDNASTMPEDEKLVKQSCITCHGGQLEGRGNTPALNKIGAKYSEEEILDIIVNGTGSGMPGGILKGEEAEQAAAWLAKQK